MKSVDLSLQDARRIAIRSQRLAGPRPPATAEGLMEIARSIRVIQIDSIAAAGARTQYLVPFSRLGPYDRAILDRLVFEDRRLFHYLAHAASLVLTEDFPIFAGRMRPYSKQSNKWAIRVAEWMEANAHLRRQVLNAIRQRGPLRSRDIEDTATEHWQSTGWTAGRNVNQMLERLWIEGEITVVGRDGSQRLWDLANRWFPAWTPRERLSAKARSDRAVELSLRALGVATEGHVYQHFMRWAYEDLKGSLRRLVDRGEAIPASVAGRRGFYLHRDHVDHEAAPWRGRTVLLSPFDNLIADRVRTKMLFDFDFGIEIYVPAAKRKRGYYVLPILSGDRLIGSADVRFDRQARRLVVEKLLFEESFGMTAAVQRAIDELETFVSANGSGSAS
ncbi:MAG: winged helix-turn-helix domain-containing protein [Chloroflexi bacterium]|nr:MAG: hypothetical protein AUI15_41045 [Actinobacteria bacterium 13_2_20CM_2_66_6]TMC76115.1 MAG: winged helix-turn-helix domain-containing protein [Chloroflexota bacterium]TMD40151.1 MAG: winged helix-turn-helix domain-containing protein [Chloroflexota bacterium]TMD70549.1 MAG: winged helix-turn-helix domain-containing protein [Chloroflexota bacterium]